MSRSINIGKGVSFAALCLALAQPSPAAAQGASAPSMFGVNEVIIQVPRVANKKAGDLCGLEIDELAAIIKSTLRENSVPAMPAIDAKPPTIDSARISLYPIIYTFSGQSFECISWISLSAESRNRVRIPPVDAARNVTVSYWRDGSLLSTGMGTAHGRAAVDAVQKLTRTFADQFKQDQAGAPTTP